MIIIKSLLSLAATAVKLAQVTRGAAFPEGGHCQSSSGRIGSREAELQAESNWNLGDRELDYERGLQLRITKFN